MTTWGRESIQLERLWTILSAHRGEAEAITSQALTRLLGLRERDGRSIREAVNALIERGCPIGSAVREPYGYFWIVTEDELDACVAQYRSRAAFNHQKADNLIAAFRVATEPGAARQVELAL
ncbi:MAG TPA: hypothetical protein VFE48_25485 [Methylomirabilota bacterium]|nr:hypothetical protein [Methylomirabilota bacterium]